MSGNVIGGVGDGAGNVIRFNLGSGVLVEGQNTIDNRILGNSIASNNSVGIHLSGHPVNDAGDGDDGANHFQNHPVLSVARAGSPGRLEGNLDSGAGTFRIEFFSNSECDSEGFGEGETFIGAIDTPAGSFSFDTAVAAGEVITATATDGDGNTSEFSPCLTASEPPPDPPSIALAPTVSSGLAGHPHSVDAMVRTATDDPVEGVEVRFAVTGATSATGACTTNGNGDCTFTYQGVQGVGGVDDIVACVDVDGSGGIEPVEPCATSRHSRELPAGWASSGVAVFTAIGVDRSTCGSRTLTAATFVS